MTMEKSSSTVSSMFMPQCLNSGHRPTSTPFRFLPHTSSKKLPVSDRHGKSNAPIHVRRVPFRELTHEPCGERKRGPQLVTLLRSVHTCPGVCVCVFVCTNHQPEPTCVPASRATPCVAPFSVGRCHQSRAHRHRPKSDCGAPPLRSPPYRPTATPMLCSFLTSCSVTGDDIACDPPSEMTNP